MLDELLLKKDLSYEELFYKYEQLGPGRHRLNKKRLSSKAMDLVDGAYNYLTGLELNVNRYYLAESMTEAICFAEAEGL